MALKINQLREKKLKSEEKIYNALPWKNPREEDREEKHHLSGFS